ncbi:MAG: PBP1A family penicillin-binding protein [bacterium]|nr:PBP1A family penicillin-binding protein [bacterium]
MKRFIIGLAVLLLLAGGALLIFAKTSVPNFESLKERRVVESTKIYDRSGEVVLYDIHAEVKRTVITFDQIPKNLKNATIAIEDSDFYSHGGVRIGSILRAFAVNIFSGELRQGGSTITQQLVKKAILTDEKTLTRKIKELILAFKVESVYSKNEILNLYLNEIPYGSNAYGVEAASETYFGKSTDRLTLAEAAYLAALPRAPTRLSPYGSHRDELEARKNLVLERMRSLGFISEKEAQRAQGEKVKFVNRALEGIRAPHFALYVKEYLVEKYGEDTVEKGGLKVITTLNWDWQKMAEELAKKFAEENEKKFNAKNLGLVALDPKTGQILVMVGSRDYFDTASEGNFNVTLARRQPGSSIKPVVYAAAFEKGYDPQTVVFDFPTEFNPSCNPDGTPGAGVRPEKCYHPENYDQKYRGPVSFREALAQSINVPSVKVLYLAGLENSLRLAERLGIKTLTEPERYGLTLVLGGGEIKLLELAGAYGVFAANGVLNPAIPILKVTNSAGEILEEYTPDPHPAIEPQVAREISDVLSDQNARAPAFGERSALYFSERPVAVKTGTTNDYRDAWVIGYVPNLVAGVWVGNNDNASMEKKVAGFIAAPFWNAFLTKIFKDLPREEFTSPAPTNPPKPVLKGEWRGGKVYKIDRISKKLATEFTPEELVEEKPIREVHSILYWLNKENPRGPTPPDPNLDPQFKNWETMVRSWALQNGLTDEAETVIPKEYDNLHRPEFVPKGSFTEPKAESYRAGERVPISLQIESRFATEQVDLFLGSQYLGSLKARPFDYSFMLAGEAGEMLELSARIYDQVRNQATISKTIKVSEN